MNKIYQLYLLISICFVTIQVSASTSERDTYTLYNVSKFERQWVKKLLPQMIDWVVTQEKKSSLVGRTLTDEEKILAEKLGIQNIALVRIVVDENLPMPTIQPLRDGFEHFGFNTKEFIGLTLGHVIYIKPNVKDVKNLLSHELVHVTQYEQMGIEKFLERYFIEIMKFGYHAAPLELEASRFSKV
ncbi:MAG: hypothetical protein ACJA0H_001325 [Francisellaceae bacterium]